MKQEQINIWYWKPITIFLICIGIFMFATKGCSAQIPISQEFTVIRLTDKYGIQTLNEPSKITLLPGYIEITESGQTFQESILEQSKGETYTRIITIAGCYTFLFKGVSMYAVHLRSNIGADRSYLNPIKSISNSKEKN